MNSKKLNCERLMEIREQHALDLYLYRHPDRPFCVLSDHDSHHMSRLEELEEALPPAAPGSA